MFKKNENTPERDSLQEGFAGMDRYITASNDLKEAAKSGLPLHAMRETRKARVRRLTRVVTAYAMVAVLLVSAVLAMPYFEADEPAGTTTENTAAVMELPYAVYGDRVLPASRTGKGTSYMSLTYSSIQSVYEFSDAIARIRIGNWLSETDDCTYYEAEVLEVYKGTLPDNIVIQQDGSSTATLPGYPLHIYGDEFFIFLKPTDWYRPEDAGPYPGITYWSPGSFISVFDYASDEDGNLYIAERFYVFQNGELELTDYSTDPELAPILKPEFESAYKAKYQGIYSIDEVLNALEVATSEGGN